MTPETGIHLSQWAMLIGGLLTVAGLFGFNHYKGLADTANERKRDDQFSEMSSKLDALITDNRKMSTEQREQVAKVIETIERPNRIDLERRFDLGYAMLQVTAANFYFVPRGVELNVDWMSTKILGLDDRLVRILLPNFSDSRNNTFSGNVVGLGRQVGRTFRQPVNNYVLTVEVLKNTTDNVTLVVGFQSRPQQMQ